MKLINGVLHVELPWRPNPLPLKNNFMSARARQLMLEAEFRKDPEYKKVYTKKVYKYIDQGFTEKVSDEEMRNMPEGSFYYLPHHGVWKDGKLRVVFDGAAKCGGVSLNSQLLPGPKVQTDLADIILRFRRFKHVVTADVKGMFNVLRYSYESSHFCRFLWRDNEADPIQIRRFLRCIFGVTSSPFQAIACVLFLADMVQDEQPEVAEEIRRQLYVDDWISSFMQAVTAVKVSLQMIDTFARGGFQLVKFQSTSKEILQQLPEEAREEQERDVPMPDAYDLFDNGARKIKTLGVIYSLDDDQFEYDLHKTVAGWKEQQWTRRKVLSRLASIYDPQGIVAPWIGALKVLNQELWEVEAKWDDPVPEEKQLVWKKEVEALTDIGVLRFDRHFHLDEMQEETTTLEIITCCDASSKLYAACSYLRVTNGDKIYTSLAACRARVAPKKTMTIPRLELTACVVGVRLANYVREELRLPEEWQKRIEMKFYTDSAIAYYWIVQEKYQSMTFVHNRCCEIRSSSDTSTWSHIRTEANMADYPSRPGSYKTRTDFLNDWQRGLPWLKQGEEPPKASLELNAEVQKALDAERKKEKCVTTFNSRRRRDP